MSCADEATRDELAAWLARPQEPAPVSRIPPEALEAVERVLAFRAAVVDEVPGAERWRSTSVEHQARKAETHARTAFWECTELGDPLDDETGEHHLAHAAARALLGLALYHRDAK